MGKKNKSKDGNALNDDISTQDMSEMDELAEMGLDDGPLSEDAPSDADTQSTSTESSDASQGSEASSEDAAPSVAEDAPEIKEQPAVAPAANSGADEGLAPSAVEEKAELPLSEHTPAEKEASQADGANVEPSVEAKSKGAAEDEVAPSEEAAASVEEPSASEPKAEPAEEPSAFSELQDDIAELAEHIGEAALEGMKKAGDALTPAVAKLHGIEESFERLGDEAKARFVHAKTMLVNAMGALERIFKRS